MLKNYLKIAYKVLLRQKFFTFVSLFGISITLTILFVAVAILDSAFTPGGRGSKLSRALYVEKIELRGKSWDIESSPSYKLLDQHVRTLKTPEVVSIHSSNTSTTVYVSGRKVELQLKYTDAEFWDIAEFEYIEGGAYSKNQVDNVDAVAVITDHTRDQVFGTGPALGKSVETTAGSFRVVGVVPRRAMPGQVVYADIWVPITHNRQAMTREEVFGSEHAIVLPAQADNIENIKSEYEEHLVAVRANLDSRFDSLACRMETQFELAAAQIVDPSVDKPTLLIPFIFGLMILFMLLPAINLMNMNISRIFERSSEIGVRKAFGASASTLIGQFVVENVVLTLAGGVLAVVLSLVSLRILNDSGVLPYSHFELNAHVICYGLIISLFFGVFSGILPAYRMSRLHPVEALRGATT